MDRGVHEHRLGAGFEKLARLLAITLGPSQRVVLSEVGRGSSEGLVDAVTVARRVTSLPERGEHAGAAILRDMVLRLGERHGDGGATAAVSARAMLRHAVRVIVAGANPVLVRRGMQAGVRAACAALTEQVEPVEGEAQLRALAAAVTDDVELGAALGEIVEVLGAEGAVQIEQHDRTDLAYDYLDGARWRGRPAERHLLGGGKTELTLVDPALAVVDAELSAAEQVRPLLEIALTLPGRPPLLLLARDVTGTARTMCASNDRRGTLVCVPVVLTAARPHQRDDFDDIAVLTGAEVLSEELGRPPASARPDQVGRAHRAVVRRGYLSLLGGGGDPAVVDDRITRLRSRVRELDHDAKAADARERLWLRQARLAGRVAALRVGAVTEGLLDARKDNARKVVRLLRTAQRDGTVPGGGVAFLDCVPAVRAARDGCSDRDEASGFDAVCAGLEAPFLQLVRNGGLREPRVALHHARDLGPGHGLDVETDTYVDMRRAGLRDVAGVAAGALDAAAETAGLLVSAEAVTARG